MFITVLGWLRAVEAGGVRGADPLVLDAVRLAVRPTQGYKIRRHIFTCKEPQHLIERPSTRLPRLPIRTYDAPPMRAFGTCRRADGIRKRTRILPARVRGIARHGRGHIEAWPSWLTSCEDLCTWSLITIARGSVLVHVPVRVGAVGVVGAVEPDVEQRPRPYSAGRSHSQSRLQSQGANRG